MPRAVIFDLNGVFLESQFLSARFKERFGISEDQFLPALKEIMGVVRKPSSPPAFSLWKPYLDKWKVPLSEEEFFRFWFSGEKLVSELVEYARALRDRGVKVFILSNNLKERTQYYRQHFPEIFKNVDKAYFSWETGLVKPSVESLKLVISENSLNPQDCLYFDDSDANIKVARSLGIRSEKWSGLPAAKAVIDSF